MEHLKIISININGLKNKLQHLAQILKTGNIDIALIQETHTINSITLKRSMQKST